MQANLTWAAGALLVVGAGTFWSLGGLLMRLIETAGPWQILLYRSLALAGFFLVVVGVHTMVTVLRTSRGALILAGACLGVAFTGFVFSITHTTVANTFFLLATQPLITALLAWRWLAEVPSPRTWLAMALALGGVSFMVADGIDQGSLFGNAMALVAALGFAGLTVTLRLHRDLDMRPGIAVGGMLTAGLATAALALGAGGPALPGWQAFHISAPDLALCIASGTVQVGCGMLLYTIATRWISAGEAALFALSEVLLAPLWVWLVVDERPSDYTLAGGLILLVALVIKSWPRRGPLEAI